MIHPFPVQAPSHLSLAVQYLYSNQGTLQMMLRSMVVASKRAGLVFARPLFRRLKMCTCAL